MWPLFFRGDPYIWRATIHHDSASLTRKESIALIMAFANRHKLSWSAADDFWNSSYLTTLHQITVALPCVYYGRNFTYHLYSFTFITTAHHALCRLRIKCYSCSTIHSSHCLSIKTTCFWSLSIKNQLKIIFSRKSKHLTLHAKILYAYQHLLGWWGCCHIWFPTPKTKPSQNNVSRPLLCSFMCWNKGFSIRLAVHSSNLIR